MYLASFILSMIAPISIFLVGILWKRKTPSRDQAISYRSELALKNDDTWEFAHSHIASLLIRVGIFTAIITVILMRVFEANYANFVLWLIAGQMILFCAAVFFVDSIMKAVFDSEGNRVL